MNSRIAFRSGSGHSVEALSEIRDGASLQALIAAMQSKDVTVRRAAAQALGQRD